jgi:hypothetical protein
VDLSFRRALDIMKIVPKPEQKNFTQVLTRQTAVIATVMSTLARIDEARLRRVQASRIDRVLAEIRKLKAQG